MHGPRPRCCAGGRWSRRQPSPARPPVPTPRVARAARGSVPRGRVRALAVAPDVLLVDATGTDHPRRAGLAVALARSRGSPPSASLTGHCSRRGRGRAMDGGEHRRCHSTVSARRVVRTRAARRRSRFIPAGDHARRRDRGRAVVLISSPHARAVTSCTTAGTHCPCKSLALSAVNSVCTSQGGSRAPGKKTVRCRAAVRPSARAPLSPRAPSARTVRRGPRHSGARTRASRASGSASSSSAGGRLRWAELDDAEPLARDARVLLAPLLVADPALRVVRLALVDLLALERLV